MTQSAQFSNQAKMGALKKVKVKLKQEGFSYVQSVPTASTSSTTVTFDPGPYQTPITR